MIKIAIATHKYYPMPIDSCYIPLYIGHKKGTPKVEEQYQYEDEGQNISNKNPLYCELTAMYWIWKNVKADYYGLFHYRRYLTFAPFFKRIFTKNKFYMIPTEKQWKHFLADTNIVLPKKRNYIIETIYSHYCHTQDREHLEKTKEVIKELCPQYEESFTWVMRQRNAHMFNMFVMQKEVFFAYCEWIFPILEELEHRIDCSQYNAFEKRYIGRIGEILLNVWIHHTQLKYKELDVLYLEPVAWRSKIFAFLKAKFFSKKYTHSF